VKQFKKRKISTLNCAEQSKRIAVLLNKPRVVSKKSGTRFGSMAPSLRNSKGVHLRAPGSKREGRLRMANIYSGKSKQTVRLKTGSHPRYSHSISKNGLNAAVVGTEKVAIGDGDNSRHPSSKVLRKTGTKKQSRDPKDSSSACSRRA